MLCHQTPSSSSKPSESSRKVPVWTYSSVSSSLPPAWQVSVVARSGADANAGDEHLDLHPLVIKAVHHLFMFLGVMFLLVSKLWGWTREPASYFLCFDALLFHYLFSDSLPVALVNLLCQIVHAFRSWSGIGIFKLILVLGLHSNLCHCIE